MSVQELELRPEQLRRVTDPASFAFQTTAELPPLQHVIGQPRAVRSIDFGVGIKDHGYNIYVVGWPGSGRTTTVRHFLGERAQQRPTPAEWCYVYNFADPRRPHALDLPAGRATTLRAEMADLVQQLQREIPKAFEGEFYEQRRREINLELQGKQQEILQKLEQYLGERGFALVRSQMGLSIVPVLEGKELTGEAYEKLDPEIKKKFEAFRPELQEQFDKTMRLARELDRQGKQSLDNVTQELTGFIVDQILTEIKEQFHDCPKVLVYLDAVRGDVVQNVANFVPSSEGEKQPLAALLERGQGERALDRYIVNVLSGRSQEGAPVVIEDNPTYPNLIGRIEHRVEFGAMVTDFTQVREGALHRANGGYLVVEAKSLLASPMAWDGLKRALRAQTIRIEDISQFAGVASTVTLEPEPIPLDIKVVMIGDDRLYQLLYAYDEDFRELFKVRAEFAGVVKRDGELTQQYALFVGDLCQREGLRPFTPGAVARIVEEGARLAEDQGRVTTRFAEVADLVREASYFCTQAGREVVQAADVRMAVEERVYRLNYAADRYLETIQEGVVLIDTQGTAVGQINGLSVVQSAGYEFGLPSRISARTFMGKAGVVSIDREVRMSGPIHDKGQLILAAYLNSRFAQKKTLSVSATLTFEQLYSGVEGDSASSTELYALLSSLADAPIKQHLAVTGSVNQAGQVQAIGGANAKIEGFFALCKARGLSGEQGVLLPASNVQHLMLSDEVIEAVAQGRFHVYGVSTIEQGLELLTGISAGEPDAEGNYPEGTLYARVQAKLDLYNQNMKDEGEEEEEEDEERECVECEEEDEGPAEEGDDPEASDEDEESDIILR